MPFFTTNDNCKLFFEEKGQGKAVIFIHGWSCNRHFFKKQLPAFQKKYHVLAYDLRGHGDSERPEHGLTLTSFANDLKELIENRELKEVSLVGWSMGVHIIFEYIKNFGVNNLHKLVLVDMSARLTNDPATNWKYPVHGGYTEYDALKFCEMITTNWPKVVTAFVPGMFGKDTDSEEIPWATDQILRNTPHVMISMWLSMMTKDYRDLLPEITVPTLVTYGKRPSLYIPENSEYLGKRLPNAKVLSYDGGHIHFMQDSEKFNREVMEFIG